MSKKKNLATRAANKLVMLGVLAVAGLVVVMVLSAILGAWLLPLAAIAVLLLARWVFGSLLPGWREKLPWYDPKAAFAWAVHGVFAFFASVWFAGAVLGRTVLGRALVFWLVVLAVVDYAWFSPYAPEPVEPWRIGWVGFAALVCHRRPLRTEILSYGCTDVRISSLPK